MKYYKIISGEENSQENEIVCFSEENYESKYHLKENDIYKGKCFENWDRNFTFYYEKSEGYVSKDYLANNLAWPIISSKFKRILDDIGVPEVQYLPINIEEKYTGKKLEGFTVVNIITLLDALDLENSVYTEFKARGKKMLSIKKYALQQEKVRGYNFVRLKKSKYSTFISEIVRNKLVENKITGCDFLEISVV
ncbi:MAG: imm11 family protein [Halanaerobiales bacterium]